MLLHADRSVLVVVDIQERLISAVTDGDVVVRQAGILAAAARTLTIPALATEQYRKGLGGTAAALAPYFPDEQRIEKISFSCTGEPAFMAALTALGRDQIVLCGIESHVCVMQTALALKGMGRSVYVVADAVSSRTPENKALALDRMQMAGIPALSTEMVVFEWLERAGTPAFKTISALIK